MISNWLIGEIAIRLLSLFLYNTLFFRYLTTQKDNERATVCVDMSMGPWHVWESIFNFQACHGLTLMPTQTVTR